MGTIDKQSFNNLVIAHRLFSDDDLITSINAVAAQLESVGWIVPSGYKIVEL